MAGEDVLRAVQDERDVALRARPGVPAGAAVDEVRPAAAVEQDDRLAARRRARGSCRGAGRRGRSRMSTICTGGSGRPSTRAGRRTRRSAWTLSGRGVALPATSSAPACSRAAQRRRGARRSAGRPRACRSCRAPRRRRSARAARSARRRPSAGRRRRARCRRAGGSTRRGARPAASLECSTATVSPKRSTKRLTICGVSAISGTSTITPRSARERGRGGAQVDLGLARAGDAVQQQRLRRGAAPALPSPPRSRRARASGRRSARGCGAARADALVVDVAARRAAGERDEAARLAGGAAPAGRAPAARGSSASSACWRSVGGRVLRRRRARRGCAHHVSFARAPGGGETSASARAGVEQYSSAIQSASSTSSGGRSWSSTRRGAASRSSGSSELSATPTTTPTTSRWPNGTTSTEPIPTPSGRR